MLGDRLGLVEEAYVALELDPVGVGVRDAAAREHAGEDLRPRGVQARVHALDERGRRREREQLGQKGPQPVGHADGAVCAANRHVDVDAEAVVAPHDVLQELVVPAVVRRVDDPLVLPAAPRMRSGRRQADAQAPGQRAELSASLDHPLRGLEEGVATAGLDLDLRGDQLADEVRLELGPGSRRLELLEAVRQLERPRVEERELLLHRDGEVGRRLEGLAGKLDLLVRGQNLLVTHAPTVIEAIGDYGWVGGDGAGAAAVGSARSTHRAATAAQRLAEPSIAA